MERHPLISVLSVTIGGICGSKGTTTDLTDAHEYDARPTFHFISAPLAVVLAVLLGTLRPDTAHAQAPLRRLAARLEVSDDEITRQVKAWTDPLYERLPLEVQFMVHIGELNAEQAAALDVAGRGAIARLADEIASSMHKYQRFDRVQIFVRANGQPAVVPWNVAQRTGEWPQAEVRPPEKLAEGEELVVQKIQVAGDVRSLVSAFNDKESYFQKALQGRLLDGQKQRLAAAERERRDFQRRALVEAVVAGFERATALTSRQWRELSAALDDLLSQDDDSRSDWRAQSLSRIVALPEEWFRPVLLDYQRPYAREQQAQMAEVARQFALQQHEQAAERPAPMVLGGGVF